MVYKIRENKHDAFNYITIDRIDEMVREICFSKSCYWDNPRNNDDYDINKLYGFSQGWHHKNSIRFGWVPDFNIKNMIKIYAYYYNNGKRNHMYIKTIKTEETYFSSIKINDDNTAELMFDNKVIIIYYKKPKYFLGYYLYPYFGGDNTAPNDMEIEVKRIKTFS